MKDSLGNDIKIPKFKEISCTVIESHQTKGAIIRGQLDFYDLRTKRLLRSDPIEASALFDHRSALASGNIDALTEESKKKLQNKPIPFPSDFQMLMDGSNLIRPILMNLLRNNRGLLEG